MRDDAFEWDDAKAASNLLRHGISFDVARRVFDDPFAVDREDHREDYGEDRWSIIAMVSERVVFVAYTRRQYRVRLIMARYAEPFEKRLYHDAQVEE